MRGPGNILFSLAATIAALAGCRSGDGDPCESLPDCKEGLRCVHWDDVALAVLGKCERDMCCIGSESQAALEDERHARRKKACTALKDKILEMSSLEDAMPKGAPSDPNTTSTRAAALDAYARSVDELDLKDTTLEAIAVEVVKGVRAKAKQLRNMALMFRGGVDRKTITRLHDGFEEQQQNAHRIRKRIKKDLSGYCGEVSVSFDDIPPMSALGGYPSNDEECRKWPSCKRHGRCVFDGSRRLCVAGSDEDCNASDGCRRHGMCLLEKGKDSPPQCKMPVKTDSDCRRSYGTDENNPCTQF